ncbi:chromosome partitioning protein [Brachybacterium sp. EF45031]|uniref:MinD/ParA family ATP-binding protein n=1 Tax=Brachybacterium sillae TaxID=2810536 RepID=UPI00217E68D4|nr:chromosome partitioning protein [Brachybacterium sillae]MCS6711565.1 chromosome partitioning protein [Brachybacterium sillae]
MIAQARITSDTTATVHLADGPVEIDAASLPEVRSQVKRVFIDEARVQGGPVDVVIVETDVVHHLQVSPNGRITGRPADDRPLYGPPIDGPHRQESRGGRRRRAGEPVTGEHVAVDADGHVSATPSASAEKLPVEERPAELPDAAFAPRHPAPPSTPSEPRPTASSTVDPSASRAAREAREARAPQPPVGAPRHSAPRSDDGRPTLQDLQTSSRRIARQTPTRGFPGAIARLTGGAILLPPTRAERLHRDQVERIRKPLDGPKNVVVVNLKGGAHKTTATLMLSATMGSVRGGGVLAWDNNETRGTLGWRGVPAEHQRTALDLLHDLDRLDSSTASVAQMDQYVRPQGETQFDILASDEDPGSAASIDGAAFQALDRILSRFYRIKVIDTGNNVRASNWLAAVHSADQLVIVSTLREDTFNAAAWMIDELRATGLSEQVDRAVTILSHSAPGNGERELRRRLHDHFGAHTRTVVEVPYEKHFVSGTPLNWSALEPYTKEAWQAAAAAVVDGL